MITIRLARVLHFRCCNFVHRHAERGKGSREVSGRHVRFGLLARKLEHRWLRPNASGPFVATLLRMTALGVFALAGCHSTAPPKPLAQLTSPEQAGHAAYNARCASCHYDRESGSLHGPSLLGVYQKPYLPSGAPANDDRIRNTILHGRGNMPALGNVVGDDEVTSILAYLRTL